jgi:hypothetical protein
MCCQIEISCYDPFNQFSINCFSVAVTNPEAVDGTLFSITDICDDDFCLNDLVDSLTTVLTPEDSDPDPVVLPLYINTFIYYNQDLDLYTTTPTEDYVLLGFTLKDSNGDVITYGYPSAFNSTTGTICFNQQEEINEDVYNFKLNVLSLQCQYSKKVLKCINSLKFGVVNPTAFQDLKIKKLVLGILNEYDVRDIVENTVLYNNFTYQEMKTLINNF